MKLLKKEINSYIKDSSWKGSCANVEAGVWFHTKTILRLETNERIDNQVLDNIHRSIRDSK